MSGIFRYGDISTLSLKEAVTNLVQEPKPVYGELKLADLLIDKDVSELRLVDLNNREFYGYGVYIVFEKGRPIYVGMAAKHFIDRFSSHLYHDPRSNWGWNALLKKIATRDYPNDDVELRFSKAKKKLLKCQVARVNISQCTPSLDIRKLERVFQRGMKNMYPKYILNGNVKAVNAEYMNTEIKELMKLQ